MNRIPVIYYHSVAPEKKRDWYKSYLTLELVYFEDLLRYFQRHNYTFLFLHEYMQLREDPQAAKQKFVCLNFDDGCLDNYVYVYPLLKKYTAKATIYVNPDFVPSGTGVRKTMENLWEGTVRKEELEELGFVSWEEMRIMERSGLVDIQSHTLTHTKYFVSDRIREIHNPKANYLYPVSNLFRDRKPYYITDPAFKTLLPYGTPFFEERSSVIARRVRVHPDFEKACVTLFRDQDWNHFSKDEALQKAQNLYAVFKKEGKVITEIEGEESYRQRVWEELQGSKQIIERELGKTILYCCWPHGDYNDYAHSVAMDCGYAASTVVLKAGQVNTERDRFDRLGHGNVRNSRFLTLLKMKYKLRAYRNEFPWRQIESLYNTLKYGR